ncbi:S8 family peptidase [Streptomyces sp. NBC_01005]|uniref:S8 family peptidase n=1 Tax=unclassified Streptomyces TaxID=2593676 RepID=UPI00386EDAF0|nr:S8 family peptidase [Streptomyces sp. NBC_01005]WTC95119.1 S8 family peptidase [Streptomyces sp. NBC_01650]
MPEDNGGHFSRHIDLPPAVDLSFRGLSGRGGQKIRPIADRLEHAANLRHSLTQALVAGDARRERIPSGEAAEETLLAITSAPGYPLAVPKLDSSGCRLVAMSSLPGNAHSEVALVSVGDSGAEKLRGRIAAYAQVPGGEQPEDSIPAEADLIANVDEIALASVRHLWSGGDELPAGERWWQLWLERAADRDEEPVEVLRRLGPPAGLTLSEHTLSFARRTVVHVHGAPAQLSDLVGTNALPVEVRPAPLVEVFTEATWALQEDLADDLAGRTVPAQRDDAPIVTVLDTGVLAQHPLLKHSLVRSLTLRTDGRAGDEHGHGTKMAGLALYGDLSEPLSHNLEVHLRHRIESMRILELDGDQVSEPDFGAVMAEAVARTEIEDPATPRAYSMSVTARTYEPSPMAGQPTAWSTAVDALAYGHDVAVSDGGDVSLLTPPEPGPRRLFFISAGNVRDPYVQNYLDRCDLMPVEDPAQSWNALTVGAYTRLAHVPTQNSDYAGWSPLAPDGELSPFSRTGVVLSSRWPNKPDIVMEGGNLLFQTMPNGELDTGAAESHGVLTTTRASFAPVQATHATSPATAQAARLAALVMDRYPHLKPETIRGLLVHCAEWTPAMWSHFTAAGAFGIKGNKQMLGALLRRYGWGVPTEERLLNSAAHDLTLIAQEEFRPMRVTNRQPKLSLMQVHDLPWPVEQLQALGDERLRMRVTLSYFVEPWVGGQGWRDRFVYPSHELRFELPRPGEDPVDFQRRVSHDAAADELGRPAGTRRGKPRADRGWLLGQGQRQRGSLSSDLWEGTASELAERGHIAVYPAGGWWHRQKATDRAEMPVTYALLVTIRTSNTETDLLTPIRSEIAARVPVSVPIEL